MGVRRMIMIIRCDRCDKGIDPESECYVERKIDDITVELLCEDCGAYFMFRKISEEKQC